MSDECVFCQIVEGTAPASVVYSDGSVMAFMDIAPIVPGHLLVIPKRHAVLVGDLEASEGTTCWMIAATLAKAPGVGKKTAERLIVDLRSKVGRLAVGPVAGELASPDEAIAALRALGYTLAEAEQALRGVPPPGKASTEERLATALRGR